MADGLEIQGIQKHVKSRYSGKFTPLAKTLQEDPSCQLCTMMQKLVIQETVSNIESVLKQQDLPALTTLRQVILFIMSSHRIGCHVNVKHFFPLSTGRYCVE